MRYVGLEHIEPNTMRLLGQGRASEVRSSSVRFSGGDVLYGKMRPYLNKVWVAEFDGICSAEFLVFPKCDGLKSLFLALRLNAKDFVTYANGQVSPSSSVNRVKRRICWGFCRSHPVFLHYILHGFWGGGQG